MLFVNSVVSLHFAAYLLWFEFCYGIGMCLLAVAWMGWFGYLLAVGI